MAVLPFRVFSAGFRPQDYPFPPVRRCRSEHLYRFSKSLSGVYRNNSILHQIRFPSRRSPSPLTHPAPAAVPIPLFPATCFLFPISYSLFPISCFLFPISYFRFLISDFSYRPNEFMGSALFDSILSQTGLSPLTHPAPAAVPISLFPIPCHLFPISYFLFPISYF